MGKVLAAAVATVVAGSLAVGGCTAVVAGALDGPAAPSLPSPAGAGQPGGTPGSGTPGGGAAVPVSWEVLERGAAASCPGLPWEVLAAIGRVESDSGRSSAPGVRAGANSAGAEGPFQFEPATFAAYATVGPGGVRPPSPYDPVDAAYTAAALLCADGGGSPAGLGAAVWSYNHSAAYVHQVLVLAEALREEPALLSTPATALAFAAAAMGTPYVWGGTGPQGYDCSGLVQAAYRRAGVALPRVAQDQYGAGPPLPAGSAVLPGDLVFYGTSASAVAHVGLYVGGGQMIDAPYTGTVVRLDPAAQADLVGATRPWW